MKANVSLGRSVLVLLLWTIFSVFSLHAENAPRTQTGDSVQQVANDYPLWEKQAAAAAMLLCIILVASMLMRGAREGWEKGKRQAESERVRKDFKGK